MWRGRCRSNISVSAPFVWRSLSGSTLTPFTGQADFPHPALGQNFRPSPTARCAQAGTCARAEAPFLGDVACPDRTALHLLGLGGEPRFQVAHDLRKLVCALSGSPDPLRDRKLGLSRKQRDLDWRPVAFADGSAEGFDIDQDVLMGGGLNCCQCRPDSFTIEGTVQTVDMGALNEPLRDLLGRS
jgi:hypothetical protein